LVDASADVGAGLVTIRAAAKEIVVVGFVMADMCKHGETYRFFIESLGEG
jgi:hypothetical protein